MWETTTNPENRRLIRITPDEAAATSGNVRPAPGDNLAGRKEYIAEGTARIISSWRIFRKGKMGIATCGFGKWTACRAVAALAVVMILRFGRPHEPGRCIL